MEPAFEHVRREFARLDLLLHREVIRLRKRHQLSLDEFRGLYISDAHVDELLRGGFESFDPDAWSNQAETVHMLNMSILNERSQWIHIAREFSLGPAEMDILFLALAPEIDAKYETIFGYLNNDVTRKYPTIQLTERIFGSYGALEIRRSLVAGAPLFRSGLLRSVAGGFIVTPGVAQFIVAPGAAAAPPLTRYPVPERCCEAEWERVTPLIAERLLLVFEGRAGARRRCAAACLCAFTGNPLLTLDAAALQLERGTASQIALEVALQSRLEQAVLFIAHGDAWFDRDQNAAPEAVAFVRTLDRIPLIFSCSENTRWRDLFQSRRAITFPFPAPSRLSRRAAWDSALARHSFMPEPGVPDELASRFVLSRGQIDAAAQAAADRLLVDGGDIRTRLFAAARGQCGRSLSSLAVKVQTSYSWSDLVLPASTLAQLREASTAVGNRAIVFDQWQMSPRGTSTALNMFFSGASGTGKTMSAGIIANELGLDLYRLDIAGVVSKYIGETERNLERVFTAARASNAILFFDEADALFGKRSEVRDAHDRYANIEVAYLLQKLEEHDGVVILATNLARNIDEAFSRRMQFVIDFPLPAAEYRERLWRDMFPPQAPVSPNVDFSFLARQFVLTGGQIRNVSLDAAFLAAQDAGAITMRLLIRAVARQFVRQGRIPTPNDFKQHYAFIAEEA